MVKIAGAILCAACFVNQTACFADEVSSTAVKSTVATPTGVQSQTYRANAGPGGAKVSSTKAAVQGNADGSVSSTREHESHSIDAAGSTHHKSASATTVGADGSTASVKHEATSTNP